MQIELLFNDDGGVGDMTTRCEWGNSDPLYVEYHDTEWGVPEHDDRRLFESLVLDGAQAGLSWLTILRKRDNYRAAFDGFDATKIANYGEDKVAELLANKGIVRNRLKVASAITNARAFLLVQQELGSFDRYLWSFVGGEPKKNSWTTMDEIPATSLESEAMSADLKKRGFRFVGPTICYAFMQAVGMVNDHMVDCFRYDQVS
jgi:DNA-3-methyladenine glycosylase I